MGLDSQALPDHIIGKIAEPAERKRFITFEQRLAKRQKDDEKKLRDSIIGFCLRHRINAVGSDPTRRSRLPKGHPDLLLTKDNRCLHVELKVRNNKLSRDQYDYIAWLRECGNETFIVEDYADGSRRISQWFGL